jgi:hypothetical protein
MFDRLRQMIAALRHRRTLRRWDRSAREAEVLGDDALRSLRSQARQLRRRIDRVCQIADERLILPRIGSNAIRKPPQCDWSYRPEVWRGPITPIGAAAVETRTAFGDEMQMFHDCAISEITVRQVRNSAPEDLAPFGLRMDVFRFDGSFLSLVVELPPSAVEGLRSTHLIRLDCVVESEKPLEIFARLNVKHGPNTEQIVRELPLNEVNCMVEFDLAYSNLNEKRIERAWIDLIFENPQMSQVTLRDLTLSRSPRAEL